MKRNREQGGFFAKKEGRRNNYAEWEENLFCNTKSLDLEKASGTTFVKPKCL